MARGFQSIRVFSSGNRGAGGGPYFDCKSYLIVMIDFFQLVQSDRFNENVYFSWVLSFRDIENRNP